MDVSLQDAYDEACRSLGESIVRERLLTTEMVRLQAALDAAKPAEKPAEPAVT